MPVGTSRWTCAALITVLALAGCASGTPTGTTRTVEEKTGATTVHVALPELDGGNDTATASINEQLQQKLSFFADPAGAVDLGGMTVTSAPDTGFTHIGAKVASARTQLLVDEVPPSGTPFQQFDADTWRLDDGTRVGIEQVFRGGDLKPLAAAVKAQLDRMPAVAGYPPESIAPSAENFDQFVVDPSGLTIWTLDGQLADGSIPVTVPWDAIRAAVDPDMLALLTS